jgi:hypothetical protein
MAVSGVLGRYGRVRRPSTFGEEAIANASRDEARTAGAPLHLALAESVAMGAIREHDRHVRPVQVF